MTKNFIFISLYAAIALVSGQKKDIEKVSSDSLIATSNSTVTDATLRYFYKSSNNNIYSGNSIDGISWTSTLINNGVTTQGSPAATVFGSNIYLLPISQRKHK